MKYIVFLGLLIVSCQSKDRSALEGKWVFVKNELFPGITTNPLQDSLFGVLEEQQKGLTLSFNGKLFKVTQLKNGREETMGEQAFELPADHRSLVLKNQGRPDDVFPVIALTDTLFKLNMFNSQEGYLVFRKIK